MTPPNQHKQHMQHHAYLQPLLDKHGRGEGITFEDLQLSWKSLEQHCRSCQHQRQGHGYDKGDAPATSATTTTNLPILVSSHPLDVGFSLFGALLCQEAICTCELESIHFKFDSNRIGSAHSAIAAITCDWEICLDPGLATVSKNLDRPTDQQPARNMQHLSSAVLAHSK